MANIINSKTDIANLALSLLGQPSISSLDTPTTETESLLSLWYDQSLTSLLRMFDWNFSVHRANLPKETEDPAFGFARQYKKPNDYVQILSIGEHRNSDWREHYQFEGDMILTNDSEYEDGSLPIRYVRYVSNVSKYDPLFIQALAILLAMNVAYHITNASSVVADMERRFQDVLSRASTADARENPIRRVNAYVPSLLRGTRGRGPWRK